ncbi:MAG: STAS domain-containing protein [Rubrivivax sp.]
MMDLQVAEVVDNIGSVSLSGRLDAPGADAIGVRFHAAVAAPGRNVIVDLSGVDFVASMGIRLLIGAARALNVKGARMVLCGAQGMVATVLEETSIDQIIPMAATTQDARTLLASA